MDNNAGVGQQDRQSVSRGSRGSSLSEQRWKLPCALSKYHSLSSCSGWTAHIFGQTRRACGVVRAKCELASHGATLPHQLCSSSVQMEEQPASLRLRPRKPVRSATRFAMGAGKEFCDDRASHPAVIHPRQLPRTLERGPYPQRLLDATRTDPHKSSITLKRDPDHLSVIRQNAWDQAGPAWASCGAGPQWIGVPLLGARYGTGRGSSPVRAAGRGVSTIVAEV